MIRGANSNSFLSKIKLLKINLLRNVVTKTLMIRMRIAVIEKKRSLKKPNLLRALKTLI